MLCNTEQKSSCSALVLPLTRTGPELTAAPNKPFPEEPTSSCQTPQASPPYFLAQEHGQMNTIFFPNNQKGRVRRIKQISHLILAQFCLLNSLQLFSYYVLLPTLDSQLFSTHHLGFCSPWIKTITCT